MTYQSHRHREPESRLADYLAEGRHILTAVSAAGRARWPGGRRSDDGRRRRVAALVPPSPRGAGPPGLSARGPGQRILGRWGCRSRAQPSRPASARPAARDRPRRSPRRRCAGARGDAPAGGRPRPRDRRPARGDRPPRGDRIVSSRATAWARPIRSSRPDGGWPAPPTRPTWPARCGHSVRPFRPVSPLPDPAVEGAVLQRTGPQPVAPSRSSCCSASTPRTRPCRACAGSSTTPSWRPRPTTCASWRRWIRRQRARHRPGRPRGPGGRDRTPAPGLMRLLRGPIAASPDSLAGQLQWVRRHWAAELTPEARRRLTLALDLLAEEAHARSLRERDAPAAAATTRRRSSARPTKPSASRPTPPGCPASSCSPRTPTSGSSSSRERMDETITTLDQVPDEVLGALAADGVNGLWLIGLWERSRASREIKQRMGNPDAAASAYAIDRYVIAADLGGDVALDVLRERADRHGIRLASDMVPNHMGLDSDWVLHHPERFIELDEPPYPGYRFTGPDLSPDPGVVIQLEDGYWDHSDAAVVFRRLDRSTDESRYIYHGNDGTATPWNDTAQLDYLQAQVREAVTGAHPGRRATFPDHPLRRRHDPRPPPHPAPLVPPARPRRSHPLAGRVRPPQPRHLPPPDAPRVLARGSRSGRRRGTRHPAAGGGLLAHGGLLRAHAGHAPRVQQRVHAHAARRGERQVPRHRCARPSRSTRASWSAT